MTNEEQEMVVHDFFFDAAIPVPEKAIAEGQSEYADDSWRNMKIKVQVTVPLDALERGLVELPEQRRHHVCFMRIKMDEHLKDLVTIEVALPDLAKLDLLNVEYMALKKEPGKIVAILELPPEIAETERQQQPPREIHKEYCSTSAFSLIETNVPGAVTLNTDKRQGRGRAYGRGGNEQRPMNSRLHTMNNYKFNYYANRVAGDEDTDYNHGVHFWPAMCALMVEVCAEQLVFTKDLVEKCADGTIEAKHPALVGAHPNLLQSIFEDRFRTYVLQEYTPRRGRKGYNKLVTYDFPRLVHAWDSKTVSQTIQGQDKFLARTEVPQDFYCCMGVDDPVQNQTRVTHACFGRLPSIYQMRYERNRRHIIRDENGEPRLMRPNSGHLVLIPFKTMFQILATLYGDYINGNRKRFYKEHKLLWPDEMFAGDDHQAKLRNERLRQEAKSEANEPNADQDPETEDFDNKNPSATLPVGDLDFGDPGIVTEVEGEQDGGDTDDREPETESSEEESSDDSEDSDSEDSDENSEASDDEDTESESSSDESSEEEASEDDNSSSTEDPKPSDDENSAPEDSDAKSGDSDDDSSDDELAITV